MKKIFNETRNENVEYINCDISMKKEVEEKWKTILLKYGHVNIIINNAARSIGKRISEMSVETV